MTQVAQVPTVIEIRVPGDKSISHRSLIFGALATGESRVRGILRSDDIESTASVLRTLGVPVPPLTDDIRVAGVGVHGLAAPSTDLDCGNSGTTARLMCGVLSGYPFQSRLTGDSSLSRRPMRRLTKVLAEMGASFNFEVGDGLPFVMTGGALDDMKYVNSAGSAQIKSALLLAGLTGGATVTVLEPNQSRDHTERMLQGQGARISRIGSSVTLRPTDHIAPLDIEVPGDPSSAAFFAAYAAMSPGVELRIQRISINPTRTGFFEVLREMGASVSIEPAPMEHSSEPIGDVVVRGGELQGVTLGREQIPAVVDELPLIACVASRAVGVTEVTGAEELRHKESDRIQAITANLNAVGAAAVELHDGFLITGNPGRLSGNVRTHGDHRIAMAFGVLGACTGDGIAVDDVDCVAVSYPGFWGDLSRVRRG